MKTALRILCLHVALIATVNLCTGCAYLRTSSTPELAGVAAAYVIKKEAPESLPFLETVCNAIRSQNGNVGTAPTPAAVEATVSQWVNKLPVISEATKDKMISVTVEKYTKALPEIQKAENVGVKIEEFVEGLEKGGI